MTLAYESPVAPARIDVEQLAQWALAPGRAGGIPWRDQAVLAFDHGCTAQLRRAARGSWALVIAGTVNTPVRRVEIQAIPDDDAGRVLAAIRALSPVAASLVIHHGRQRTRPGWIETVETLHPRLSPSGRPWIAYEDPKRRAQPYCAMEIHTREEVTEAAIRRYRAWWGGLLLAAEFLVGRLERWQVSGFAAPETPWEGFMPPAPSVWVGGRWPIARRFARRSSGEA